MIKTAYALAQIDAAAQMVVQHSEAPVIMIIGEMGAGKTTLLKVLAGELAPDSGERFLFVYCAYSSRSDWCRVYIC